jgi:hypothetical protein
LLFLKLSSHTSLHQLLWCLVRRTTDCYTRLPRCCTRTGQCNCCAHSPTSLRCPVRWLVHSRMVSHFLMRSVEIVTMSRVLVIHSFCWAGSVDASIRLQRRPSAPDGALRPPSLVSLSHPSVPSSHRPTLSPIERPNIYRMR